MQLCKEKEKRKKEICQAATPCHRPGLLTGQVTCLPCQHLSRHRHPPAQRRGAVTRLGGSQARRQALNKRPSVPKPPLPPRTRQSTGAVCPAGACPVPTASGPLRQRHTPTDRQTDRPTPAPACSPFHSSSCRAAPSPAHTSEWGTGGPHSRRDPAGNGPRPAATSAPGWCVTRPPPQAAPAESRRHRPARYGGPTASIPLVIPPPAPLTGCPKAAASPSAGASPRDSRRRHGQAPQPSPGRDPSTPQIEAGGDGGPTAAPALPDG